MYSDAYDREAFEVIPLSERLDGWVDLRGWRKDPRTRIWAQSICWVTEYL